MRLPAYLLGLLSVGGGLAGCGADPNHDPAAQAIGDQTSLQNQTATRDAPADSTPPAARPVATAGGAQAPDAPEAGSAVVASPPPSAPAPDAPEAGSAVVASSHGEDAGAAPDSGPAIPAFSDDPCVACGLG